MILGIYISMICLYRDSRDASYHIRSRIGCDGRRTEIADKGHESHLVGHSELQESLNLPKV